jgi:hypothetical protein
MQKSIKLLVCVCVCVRDGAGGGAKKVIGLMIERLSVCGGLGGGLGMA